MTLAYHVPALSVGNELHMNVYPSSWYIQPDFLTFAHPAHAPQFSWPTISYFQHLDHVLQVCVESYAVGWVIVCSTMVIIHSSLHWALTTPSSVSNGSKLPGRFRVRIELNPDRGNGSYHLKNPDRQKWGGFTTKHPAIEIDHFGSN